MNDVERNRAAGCTFSVVCFVLIPAATIGYSAYSILTGDYRHLFEKLIASGLCALLLWYWINVQTAKTTTTDYEEMVAEYWNWYAAGHGRVLDAWQDWHDGQISYEQYNQVECSFKSEVAQWHAALENFRTDSLSNNVLKFRH